MNVGSDQDGGVDNLVLDYRDRLRLVAVRHADLLYSSRRKSRAERDERAVGLQERARMAQRLLPPPKSLVSTKSTMAAVSFNQPDLLQPYKDIIAGSELIPLQRLVGQHPRPTTAALKTEPLDFGALDLYSSFKGET